METENLTKIAQQKKSIIFAVGTVWYVYARAGGEE